MIVSSVYRVEPKDVANFHELATSWLTELAKLPGWLSGSLARSVDDIDHWLIYQRWVDAGSCRRALSKTELRPIAFELAKYSISEISTFEPLFVVEGDQINYFESIRAQDADTFSLAENKLSDEV